MTHIIIELITLTATLTIVRYWQSQQQSEPVAIPVRTDENLRRR